ncbi:dipeptidase [Treponema sp.]
MSARSNSAQALHDSLIVIDGHCDTLLTLVGQSYLDKNAAPRDFLVHGVGPESGHMDLPRLLEAGVTCQTFALFTDDDIVHDATAHSHRLIDALEKLYPQTDRFLPALQAADIRRAKREGKVAAFLSIEGGEAIGESLAGLHSFYKRGVRMMGLTWNRRNALARGVGVEGTDGLSDFGRSVIREMEKIGMIVDVSHLSDAAFDDTLAMAERPLVASHSNSRVLCAHRRNLTDDQVLRIAKTGGLVGLCFAGIFIDTEPAKVNFQGLMAHLDHLLALVGPEHVGLGSDFDGYTWKPRNGHLFLPRRPAYYRAPGSQGLEGD